MKITKASLRQNISHHLGLKKECKNDDDLIAIAVLYLLVKLTKPFETQEE